MSRWSDKDKALGPWPAILLFLFLFLLLPTWALFSDYYIYSKDSMALNYVIRRWHVVETLGKGFFPTWNPHLFGGIYHGANIVSGVYSPTTLFYYLVSGPMALMLSLSSLWALSALGVALLARQYRAGNIESILWGLCWAFSGLSFSLLGNYPYFAGLALIPWVVFGYVLFLNGKRLPATIIATFFSALILFEGDLQNWCTVHFFLIVLCLASDRHNLKRNLLFILMVTVSSLCLSAVAWIPAVENLSLTERSGGLDLKAAQVFSLHPKVLLDWFHAGNWGFYANGTFKGKNLLGPYHPFQARFFFDSIYLLPVLILFFAGLSVEIIKKKWPLFLLCLLFLILSFGVHTPIFALFFKLPIVNMFRFPAKYMIVFQLIVFYLIFLSRERLITKFFKNELQLTVYLFFSALLFWQQSPPLPKIRSDVLQKKLTQADLLKRVEYRRRSPVMKMLRDRNLDFYPGNKLENTMDYNYGILTGRYYTFGYDPSVPSRMRRLAGAEMFDNLETWIRILGIDYILSTKRPQVPKLAAMHAQKKLLVYELYPQKNMALLKTSESAFFAEIRAEYETAENEEESFQRVRAGSEKLILERHQLNGLTLPSFAARQRNLWDSSFKLQGSRMDFNYDQEGDHLLYIKQNYHPAWMAYSGNNKLKIVRANWANMAVVVTGKEKERNIQLRFSPPGQMIGMTITIISFFVLFILLGLQVLRITAPAKNAEL